MTGEISFETIRDTDAAETVDLAYVIHGTAKAWANLNGTGTIALRDSFNVSSVDDDGTGRYGFNLTNAMADGNQSAFMSGTETDATFPSAVRPFGVYDVVAGSVEVYSLDNVGSGRDFALVMMGYLGDVA